MLKSDDTIDRANWRASLSGLAAALAPGRWRRHRFFAGGFSTQRDLHAGPGPLWTGSQRAAVAGAGANLYAG